MGSVTGVAITRNASAPGASCFTPALPESVEIRGQSAAHQRGHQPDELDRASSTASGAGSTTIHPSRHDAQDDRQYAVKSEKSGGTAVHKPDALKKRS
jgi:hypothetical protein